MEEFNETLILYGDLIIGDSKLENLRCVLTTNPINTEINRAEVSIPSSLNANVHKLTERGKKFIFRNEDSMTFVYLESTIFKLEDKFSWEASLTLYPNKLVVLHNYSKEEIKKVIISAYISASEVIFNRIPLVYHQVKGLLSGWGKIINQENPEWIDNNLKYNSEIGQIELIPGFVFKELKGDNYNQNYRVYRQLIVHSKVINNKDVDKIEELFLIELDNLIHALSFIFVKRFHYWYLDTYSQNIDNGLILEKKSFYRLKNKTKIKDGRFVYGKLYNNLLPAILSIINSIRKLSPESKALFDKLLDRYLVAFTYEKVDTQIIYALSCLDLIRNSFPRIKNERKPFVKHLLDVCEANNIDWLDLFPYLTKERVYDPKLKEDMYLNKLRNDIIHHGIYPANYAEAHKEINKARALSERFILKLLSIDYHSTGLGLENRY